MEKYQKLFTRQRECLDYLRSMTSNAGINVWASQKEKTSLGPVMRSY